MELGKQTYIATQRWLPTAHPYRSAGMVDHFDGKLESRSKPHPITTQQ
jgi:hypothetical protein